MDQLVSLRVFRDVVDAGSFVAAADRQGLSAPMVSKHIAELERRLGVRLLHRSSRRLTLTAAGATYHAQCSQALDLLDEAAAGVGQAASEPAGELKVSAPVWCANDRFAALLASYRRRHPRVTLDLHLDNRKVDLVAEGFDVALRATAEPSPALIARPLCSVPFAFAASPGFLARQAADPQAPGATLDAILPNYVHLDRLPGPRQPMDAVMRRLAPVMRSNDTTLTRHAALAGIGVALLPLWLIEGDLADGRLKRLDDLPVPGAAHLYAVYTSRRQMLPRLRSFIDFLVEALADAPGATGAA